MSTVTEKLTKAAARGLTICTTVSASEIGMPDWRQHLIGSTLTDAGTSGSLIPKQYSEACTTIVPIERCCLPCTEQ